MNPITGIARDECEELARALGSGHCHKLRELRLTATRVLRGSQGGSGFPMVLQALQRGACPNLTKIDLGAVPFLPPQDALALAELLRSHACPQLKALVLSGAKSDEAGMVDVVEALLNGNYPNLRHLTFGFADSNRGPAAIALARFLSSRRHSQLEKLHLIYCEYGYENGDSLGLMLEAIGAGYCRELRHLGIIGAAAMNNSHARILRSQVLAVGSCPLLEGLNIWGNRFLTYEGLAPLFAALEQGACPHLKNIDLEKVKVGATGAATLVHALTSGSLSHLQYLNLIRTKIGDEPTRNVLQALASSCPDLRKIDLSEMGASSQALAAFHEALGSNAWPGLEEINLFFYDEEMACDLVSMLAARGVGTCLRHIELGVPVKQGIVVQRLADIFYRGACPALRELVFHPVCSSRLFEDLGISKRLEGSLAGRARAHIAYW